MKTLLLITAICISGTLGYILGLFLLSLGIQQISHLAPIIISLASISFTLSKKEYIYNLILIKK